MTTADRLPSTRWILACAFLYAVLTLAFLGDRPITRVQEARVLETSRQMLDSPDWHGWLVPSLNGEARLRKPPLCYWYTAAAFNVFGIDEWAGRLPTLAIGWACVLVTYFFGKDLLGRRGGFLAAAVLASSMFFLRYIRSAETDVPAMLGMIVAGWGMTRGVGINKDAGIVTTTSEYQSTVDHVHRSTCLDVRRSALLWFHLAAFGIALAAMSKGGPAIFPLVFLGLLCWAMRSRAPVMRFLFSCAPLTALLLIVPWFAFVMTDPAGGQVGQEIVVVTAGGTHRGVFLEYVPVILHMLLPWTPMLIVAFFAKNVRRAPIDLPGRVAVCSVLCVFLPLCVTLNVQPHYLLPALPPFALLIAWTMTRGLEAIEQQRRTPAGEKTARVFETSWGIAVWTAAVLGGLVIVVELVRHHGRIGFAAIAAGVALILAGLLLLKLGKGSSASRQTILWASLMIAAMPIVAGWWAPNFNPNHGRDVAAAVREQFGKRPLIGWGKTGDITLSFNLRQAIPWLTEEAVLRDAVARQPDAVVVTQRDERGGTPVPDIGLHKRYENTADGDTLEFYDLSAPPASRASTQP